MAAVGDQLAHYRIEQLLGAGGMGEVYVAFDQTLERRVALKLLPEGRAVHADARLRMLREARAASGLAHPGIVTVYEIGEVAGRTYIAMELVEGETLAQLLSRRGALPPAEAIGLFRQIGDAIVAAHAAGILHRDLKPANLMLARGGHVKVLDFGLSKRVGAPSQPPSVPPPPPSRRVDAEAETVSGDPAPIDPRGETVTPALAETQASDAPSAVTPSGDVVTVHGARMGTPGSAAPELMDGEDADVRSDVFSLGVVLHELVTGKPPFPWTSWEDIRLRILEQRYRRASELVPGALGVRLAAVIARALAPAREQRYATVADLVVAAEAAVSPPRRRWPIFVGVGAVATCGVVAGVLAWPRDHAPPPPLPPVIGPVTGESDVPAPVKLTHSGSCAYSPTFADATTVVYDVTPTAGTPDLYAVAVTGGEATRLTDAPAWEWRAAPGRSPGKIVFLLDDSEHEDDAVTHGIAELDVATHAIEKLSGVTIPAAVTAGGDVYYLGVDGTTIRRVRGSIDEGFVDLGLDLQHRAELLTASLDGKWLVTVGPPPETPMKRVEVASGNVTTLPAAVPGNSRPAFSVFEPAVYYIGAAGLRRIRLDGTGDELLVPEVPASGGIAVSPDGAWLVYSSCDQRSSILDVSVSPPVLVEKETYGAQPVVGPNGWIAWVSQFLDYSVLMVRSPAGKVEQLTSRTLGKVSTPSFDAKGTSIAFAVEGGDRPGIYTMALTEEAGSRRMILGMTGREGDLLPLFAGDDVLFTRFTDEGVPYVFRAPIAGGVMERLLDEPAMALSIAGNGAVLLGTGPDRQFRMFDPRNGKVTTMRLPGELNGVPKFSPNGDWIAVTGDELVWRLHLDHQGMTVDQTTPEQVFEIPPDGLAGYATITDDGRVIAAPTVWAGEIFGISAPKNSRW